MAGLDASPAVAEMQNFVPRGESLAATLLIHQPVERFPGELCITSVRAVPSAGEAAPPDQAGASNWLIIDRHAANHGDVAQGPVATGHPNGARRVSGLVKEEISLKAVRITLRDGNHG